MKTRIGFIGLGIMGRHMSRHLIKAGYALSVYDLNPSAVKELAGQGATACAGCREVAAASDVVISMVPDSPDVEKVALGENGLIEAARSGLIYIDMSTIAPACCAKSGGNSGSEGRALPGCAGQRG
jgi:2-hydroxy-3-oxopropionate reductase